MTETRIKFSNIVQNQLPAYIREEFPLVSEFLSQYYISQEFKSSPIDLIQNIDRYVKIDEQTNLTESAVLSGDLSINDDTIYVSFDGSVSNGTYGFPDSYGLIKIDDEIITYTGKTSNSFTGCIRGFSGITSYDKPNSPDELVFSQSEIREHTSGAVITNLSSLFLKEFLVKSKYQLLPGFGNRELNENINQSLFIKQAKDFYRSKGTDESFQILFKALYGEHVSIIRPKDYLFRPSDAHYLVTEDLVVESISGDPLNLSNLTLYQDEYNNISKAYAPITKVEKIISGIGNTYYKLSLDAGYNRDIGVDGSIYGNFSIHPKTKVIGQVSTGTTFLSVDSTVGFPQSGELSVVYSDGSSGVISYSSKSLTQFFGCSNISGTILDASNVGINTFAYAVYENEVIKIKINSVLENLTISDDTYYYSKGDSAEIKTLGINSKDSISNNWLLNLSTKYDIQSLVRTDSSDNTYQITTKNNHIFKIGDSVTIIGNGGTQRNSTIIDITSQKSFTIKGQGELPSNETYSIKRNILKVNSSVFPSSSIIDANVQNVYKSKDKLLVSSPSLPYYNQQALDASNRLITFTGTFAPVGIASTDIFNITSGVDHGFYTGDLIYYTPEKTSTSSTDSEGNVTVSSTILSSLFDEGLYYVKRVDPNNVKFAKSRTNINNSIFISVSGNVTVTNNTIEPYDLRAKSLGSQKLLREISTAIDDGQVYPTKPGTTGILINGVEILNYKSKDNVYYGPIEEIIVTAGGSNYDVINPPILNITDSVGVGATGYCAVSGNLKEIRVIDPGFDYEGTPSVNITGGNGLNATALANMKLISYEVSFNSQSNAALVSLGSSLSTIGFSTYHKFRNSERVIYKTSGQKAVGGLSTDSSYYVSVTNPYTVRLHKTLDDAVSGINTITLTSYGVGSHALQSYDKKSVLASVTIVDPGSGYENKKKTVSSSGISTSLDSIQLKNHEFKSGEIITYNTDGTSISGLSTNTNYYVTRIDDDSFKLSQVGITTSDKDFYYKTNQYVKLNSVGSGNHIFNYPEISVEIVGNIGIASTSGSNFKAIVQPIFRGEITSIHLSNTGVGYGSPDILNYNRIPSVTLNAGVGGQFTPVISDGKLVEVIVNDRGNGYNSPPDLTVNGDGTGASITPIVENGKIQSVKVIEGGAGYKSSTTSIIVTSAGTGVKFLPKIKSWNVNLFQKYFNNITTDDGFIVSSLNSNYGLQYTHVYAPRKLREIIYSVDQTGNILYGGSKTDLKKIDNNEVVSTDHSPIIGWAYDGNPIYGPYGYVTKQGGIISQMKSGYVEDLKPNRPSLTEFPLGFFTEDYTYLKVSDETVLDENNGRFCVTPEFPNGTYAYFATINNSYADSSGTFSGYKRPVFPYLIGENYKSKPNDFNFKKSSNQDEIDLNQTDWSRNTYPYNLIDNSSSYSYLTVPNLLNQTIDVKYASPGYIESIGITTGGSNYKVNDSVVFDNDASGGYSASAKVSRLKGKSVNSVSVATSTIYNVEFYPTDNKGSLILISPNPHKFTNGDTISVSGLSTDATLIEGSYKVGISTINTLTLSAGIGASTVTGIDTYFSVVGNLNQNYIRENDIFVIGSERVKVLAVDNNSSRIRVLRSIDSTVGSSHTATEVLYEDPRKLTINSGFKTSYDYKINKEIYFDPRQSVGLGTRSGVGIGTTIFFSNPGVGITQIFIPTKTIYIPNHQLQTGDQLVYSLNGGSAIGVSTNGISSSVTLSDQSILYVAKVSDDLIGISTVKVGLGSTGTFLGITTATNGLSTLFFTGIGTGTYHSFKTNYSVISGRISRNLVTVSVGETHGLQNDDNVFVDVNPSISTSFVIKYNDYNRKLLVSPKSFSSAGVNTSTETITITNHGFINGQKVIHNSPSPSGGLQDNQIYYVVIVDDNNIRLSNNYYSSIGQKPTIVGITSSSSGTLSPVNPPIQVYRNSTVTFDLSDSSLSYLSLSNRYPAFDLTFYKDSNFTEVFNSTKETNVFEIQKYGTVGVTTDAKVILTVNDYIPDKLYYTLVPIYNNINLPAEKAQVNIDSSVFSNNEIQVRTSVYNGKHNVTIASTNSFTYNLSQTPEATSYSSTTSILEYETDSLSAYGPISKIDIVNKGQNYYSLPGITSVISNIGSNALLEASSNTIGKIKKTKINDIGFDFPSDFTIRPSVSLPQICKIDPLASFESIGITSVGRGYTCPAKLVVLDGKTNQIVPEVDLRYNLGDTQVTILRNAYGLNNVTPTILPTQNSNGVGISSISFDSITKDVTVVLSVGFSTADSFPFAINDKVLIENISVGVNSTAKGYNSSDYNYQLFTINYVDANLGGNNATVKYNIGQFLNSGEIPGNYDSTNSSGRIVPQKYFPIFNPILKKNNFLIDEAIKSPSANGYVESWNNLTNYLKIRSTEDFVIGETVEGSVSKTQGIISTLNRFDSFLKLNSKSKVEKGWQDDAGFLNQNLQKIQDSYYYQNFSYSLKSKVDYDTWKDSVDTLNHTLGFKRFADYQLESALPKLNSNSMVVGLSTDLTYFDSTTDIVSFVDLNCVYDFDSVRENSLQIGSSSFSDEITFSSRILTDYFESVGNRVLYIDDISSQFNSNPRSSRFSEVHRFDLGDARAQKYITYVRDRRYSGQRQVMLVTLLHDGSLGYISQYGRVESTYDQGSFDFAIEGTEGILLFYPTKYTVNDYNVTTLSYNLKDNLTGAGSSSFGGIVDIKTSSVSVSSGATTIVGIASTYTSAKVLVEITGSNGDYQFDELSILHDGTTIEFIDYGQLTTISANQYSNTGLGTYYPYLSGSQLKIDFTPFAGIGVTVNTIQVAIGNTLSSGIGTFDMKRARLSARSTSISSSPSPVATVIAEYPQDYDCAYAILQVSDTTNNRHQLSELVILDDDAETYFAEYANVETFAGLGTVGAATTTSTRITFTPLPNINVQVKIFFNALRYQDDEKDVVDFNNATLETNDGVYYGTERDIKRAFELSHDGYKIFQRYFDASDSTVVDTTTNIIKLPNHFFVSGEELIYTNAGAGSTTAIGIATTSFVGVGTTNRLPSSVYAVKLNNNSIRLAASAADALKSVPVTLDITSVGIGTTHSFTSKNQNAKVLVAIDNLIQSPVVASAVTTTLSINAYTTDDVLYFSGITSFFGGDLIKIGSEIMRIDAVGFGSTNAIRVRRPWLGTVVAGYSTGSLVTKVSGNYNIVDNTINFVEAPYGNIPLSTSTNAPDERDWVGISTSSSFQGRTFLRSGVPNTSNETYYKNYIFDDISSAFNGIRRDFTLKSNKSNVSGIYDENAIILINDIFQEPGLSAGYTLSENTGITSISFVGTGISVSYDINNSNLPVGGIIVSVGSSEGFGYQPLVSAGGTASISGLGTVSSISIGNSGSGYRAANLYQVVTNTSSITGIGSTVFAIANNNSVFKVLEFTNSGSNCKVSIGTYISNANIISVGTTTINIGSASTSTRQIPSGTKVIVSITNPTVGYVNVGVGTSGINTSGISTITHIGIATIRGGYVVSPVSITNPGSGYTSTSRPYVVIDDPLSYSNIPLIYSSSSSGIGTQATIDIVVGQGSSIIDFELKNTGYGYGQGEILTIAPGGLTGIPTTSSALFREFQISVQNTFSDKFTGWSIGQLQALDDLDSLFNGKRVVFPITYLGSLVSILASKGSNISVQDSLLVFINDVLQVPGEAYYFPGGSSITFAEPPKSGDSSKIIFYKGSGSIDVVERNILETVKIGDELTIGYDSSSGQSSTLQEETRTVTNINSTDLVNTNPYFGPGNTSDETLLRPVVWCRQTEDKIINEKGIGKDRILYEASIYPSSYLIQSVGIGSTIVYVDNIRPFFNPLNENNTSLSFQKDIAIISQDSKVAAAATAVVSTAGTISRIVISDGGVGYTTNPSVTIQNPVGLGTTQRAQASSTISAGGTVSSITVTSPGTGYTFISPPNVLIELPFFSIESNTVNSYEGDFGIITGIATTSVGVASTAIVFDFLIPNNSFLRNSAISGVTTVSAIQPGYYFVVYNSNVGRGVTSLNSSRAVVGVGSTFLDNVYQAVAVSIAQTSTVGFGFTYVAKVTASLSSYNGLSGIGFSNFYGEFSWGRISLGSRSKDNSYNAYTLRGFVGLSTGTMIRRSNSLKYLNYM
jgi:hypothetical protein